MNLEERARLAVLPFAIVELWDLPCAYERSLKLSRAGLIANRYMIGVSRELINADQLLLACSQMRMPTLFEGPLRESFDRANLVLLGFEDEPSQTQFKVYLEIQPICEQPSNSHFPILRHIGWKWDPLGMGPRRTAYYHCFPGLNYQQVLSRISVIHDKSTGAMTNFISMIFQRAMQHHSEMVYMEVNESDTIRSSFDLNVYDVRLSVASVSEALRSLVVEYSLDMIEFNRFLELAGEKTLGHLSGGKDRRGQDFCTIYFS